MAYVVQLKDFEGPLDLLLHLIGRAKVRIEDIFVSEITEQYLASVQDLSGLDMDAASEFLQMAATLLEIKSRAMLPKPPKPEDENELSPEEALIRQLEEYAAFKQIAADMQSFERAATQLYHKLPEEYPLPPPSFEITGLTLEGLINAFARVMARQAQTDDEPKEQQVRRIIRDEHTVPMCMAHILRQVRKAPARFETLLSPSPTREEVVTLFLAMLELLKLGKITFFQDGIYGDISVSCA